MAAEWFVWRAIQGGDTAFVVDVSGGTWTGTETLTCAIHKGDGQAAWATLTPTWDTDFVDGLIDVTVPSATLDSLGPGSFYVDIYASGVVAARGRLNVLSGSGASDVLRVLCTPADAVAILPQITKNAQQIDGLGQVLMQATVECEKYCRRHLLLSDYDHFILPQNTTKLRLKNKPLAILTRLQTGMVVGLTISNTGVTNATVTVNTTGTGMVGVKTLILTSWTNGIKSVDATLNMGSYATFNALATAIAGVGNGWGVTVGSYGGYPLIDAFGTLGTFDAKSGYELLTHSDDVRSYDVDAERAVIQMHDWIPGNYTVRNPKLDRMDPRYYSVRATYRSGYAYLQADLALGYGGVPDDLQAACAFVAQSILEAGPGIGPVLEQSVKDRSYKLRDEPSIIPPVAEDILQNYLEVVF